MQVKERLNFRLKGRAIMMLVESIGRGDGPGSLGEIVIGDVQTGWFAKRVDKGELRLLVVRKKGAETWRFKHIRDDDNDREIARITATRELAREAMNRKEHP